MTEVMIKILPQGVGLPLPTYATVHSAGMDLYAAINIDVVLKPMMRFLVSTGVVIALPEGFEGQVRSRSGLALKYGVTVLNSPGTIDADYRGEIGVMLINLGKEDFTITRGMRIAQIIIAPYTRIQWHQVTELKETIRGNGGFGSTGLNA